MTTTLQDLIDDARIATRDAAQPYLWTDADWTKYANDAQLDACRRAKLITDTLTDDDGATPTPNPVCLYSLAQGATLLTLHPSVIFVRRVLLLSTGLPIPVVRREDLDLKRPGWESDTGDILAFCRNYQKGKLLFYPPSAAADQVRLTVLRTPLQRLALASPGPAVGLEIDDRYREAIVNGMLARAHKKPGEETLNADLAKFYEQLFTAEFGDPSSASWEQWVNDHAYDDLTGML